MALPTDDFYDIGLFLMFSKLYKQKTVAICTLLVQLKDIISAHTDFDTWEMSGIGHYRNWETF